MFDLEFLMLKLFSHFGVNIISCGVWSVPVFGLSNYSISRIILSTQICSKEICSHECTDSVLFSTLIEQTLWNSIISAAFRHYFTFWCQFYDGRLSWPVNSLTSKQSLCFYHKGFYLMFYLINAEFLLCIIYNFWSTCSKFLTKRREFCFTWCFRCSN